MKTVGTEMKKVDIEKVVRLPVDKKDKERDTYRSFLQAKESRNLWKILENQVNLVIQPNRAIQAILGNQETRVTQGNRWLRENQVNLK